MYHVLSELVGFCGRYDKLHGTRRASVGGYASTCCDLDLWPFDLISMSQAQLHTWRNCGKITSNSYKDIVFTRFLVIACCGLTFDLLSPISNQHMNPNTFVTKTEWSYLHYFFRYGVQKVFGTHRLTHSLTDGRPEYRMPPALCFEQWRRHKTLLCVY